MCKCKKSSFSHLIIQGFLLDNHKPYQTDNSFHDAGDAYAPPNARQSPAPRYKQQCHRYAQIIAGHTDCGRRHGAPHSVEYTLYSDFEHHEYLRIAIYAQKHAAGFVSYLLGYKDRKYFVSIANKKEGTERTEDKNTTDYTD